jgi:hypothetical protein
MINLYQYLLGLYVVLQSLVWLFVSLIMFHCVLLDYIQFIQNKISYGKKIKYHEAKIYNILKQNVTNELNSSLLPLKDLPTINNDQ